VIARLPGLCLKRRSHLPRCEHVVQERERSVDEHATRHAEYCLLVRIDDARRTSWWTWHDTGGPMDDVEGAKTFGVAGGSCDSFMGRYSRALADQFADAAGVEHGHTAVDVACGPGALTGVPVDRLGVEEVAACDPM